MLRQFLYRDTELVREFLAQLEGGIYETDNRTARSEKQGGLGASIGAPFARAEAKRAGQSGEESQRLLQQTPSSEFERLHQQLETQEFFVAIQECDDEGWSALQRGAIIEVEVVVRLGGLRKLMQLVSEMKTAMAFMQSIGSATDPKSQATLDGMEGLARLDDQASVPIVASVAAAPRFQFACELRASALVADQDRLEGEATLLGKVQRKLRRGERYLPISGMSNVMEAMATKDKAALGKTFSDPKAKAMGLADPSVGFPGIVLTPIALYR